MIDIKLDGLFRFIELDIVSVVIKVIYFCVCKIICWDIVVMFIFVKFVNVFFGM